MECFPEHYPFLSSKCMVTFGICCAGKFIEPKTTKRIPFPETIHLAKPHLSALERILFHLWQTTSAKFEIQIILGYKRMSVCLSNVHVEVQCALPLGPPTHFPLPPSGNLIHFLPVQLLLPEVSQPFPLPPSLICQNPIPLPLQWASRSYLRWDCLFLWKYP